MCVLPEPARYSWGWGGSSREYFLVSLQHPAGNVDLPPLCIFASVSVSAVEQRLPSDAVPMCLFLLQELFWVCSDGI